MHFYVCHINREVRWSVGSRPGLCRFSSAQPSIGSTINEFSVWGQFCGYWRFWVVYTETVFCKIYYTMLYLTVVEVNWWSLCQDCHWAVFMESTPRSLWEYTCTPRSYYLHESKLIGYSNDSTLIAAVPNALELQLRNSWTVTSARLVSGVTYWVWNWMRVRLYDSL